MKKRISDKDLDKILNAHAMKIKDKYGTNEQILTDLKNHFEKEKDNKSKKINSKRIKK